ncbi:hypothetical protein PV367_08060 [Streptomyces europaeiscabiei]|uniref:Beta-xylosidase C-terminal Concanavalin A-like domain-containing protein n=1 Tax=Streptomyces europaeiscabiei TaxID=146819 RepID=A0AAJ2UKM4_9ACTN|nr:hypothetical protein [Streptomyces europaeiscabiei]MDX3129751.1 hypothetical protein [Streptomyces europaeiscabiei]
MPTAPTAPAKLLSAARRDLDPFARLALQLRMQGNIAVGVHIANRDTEPVGGADQLTNTAATVKAPVWVRLTRTATQVSAYYSTDGSTFTQVGSTVTLPSMAATQDAGVIHTAHSTTAGSATFSNLRIVTSPYKAYGSIPAAVSQSGGVTSLTSAGIDI